MKNSHKGFTLLELLVVVGLMALILNAVVTFLNIFLTYRTKHQQLVDLQLLGRISLEQMSREIRQATEVKNVPAGQNYILGVSSLGIVVPNLNTPYNPATSEEIWYSTGTYQDYPNRLLQRAYSYQASGGAFIQQPWIPIIINMDKYRKTPGGIPADNLGKLFNDPHYQYDNVTVYWNSQQRTVAIGLVVSARDTTNRIITRLPLTKVVKMRRM